MEIVQKMQVPAGFLYDTIINSVLSDIESHTEKKISEKQLEGFEYTKKFSKYTKAIIKIEEVTKNESYEYRTTSNRNDFSVSYKIRLIDNESCELHYIEKMESFGYLQSLNDTVLGLLWSPMKKKKFKQMLTQIEASHLNKAEGQ